MDAPCARVQLVGGRLDLEWPAFAACTALVAQCRLRDGTLYESAGWEGPAAAEHRYRTSCGPLRIELELQAIDDRVRMCIRAEADAVTDVAEVAIAASCALADGAPAWVLCNGYQSWDASGPRPASEGRCESWWTVGLGDALGTGIAAAAVSATSSCTKFACEEGTFSTIWCETETLERWPSLFAGMRWQSEEVLLCAGPDVRVSLGRLLPSPPQRTPAPSGWLSWYHFGPWVSQDDIVANARTLAGDPFRGLGYRLVQIDDGWQEAYGEWRANQKFSDGLPTLCQRLGDLGQIAGLWLAPFLVSVAADLASEAPEDWFIRDPATGERAIDERHRMFGPMNVLDASRPAVLAHLTGLFSELYDAGFRYFKIDFLYAGAYGGTRALRAGLEAIRAGARDARIVASGTPLLPVVGVVDGCRIGPDTATPFYDFETGSAKPTVFGDEVLRVTRCAAARHFLSPWFLLDADVALVGGNLTLEQGRQLVTVAALSGGPFLAGDDLDSLPPERLALITNPEVLELAGGEPATPDWEPDPVRAASHWRRGDVLAIFNWEDEQRSVAVRAPGALGARDLWAREEQDDFTDGALLDIPAHGVRLFRLS
jgi:hypothetical protein